MANKFDLSKLKELSSLDIKDIGKIFKKNGSEDLTSSYDFNKVEKKRRVKEKSKAVLSIDLGSKSIKLVEGKFQKNKLSINKIENIINEYFARLFLQNIENFLDKEKLAALFFPATIISLIL